LYMGKGCPTAAEVFTYWPTSPFCGPVVRIGSHSKGPQKKFQYVGPVAGIGAPNVFFNLVNQTVGFGAMGRKRGKFKWESIVKHSGVRGIGRLKIPWSGS